MGEDGMEINPNSAESEAVKEQQYQEIVQKARSWITKEGINPSDPKGVWLEKYTTPDGKEYRVTCRDNCLDVYEDLGLVDAGGGEMRAVEGRYMLNLESGEKQLLYEEGRDDLITTKLAGKRGWFGNRMPLVQPAVTPGTQMSDKEALDKFSAFTSNVLPNTQKAV